MIEVSRYFADLPANHAPVTRSLPHDTPRVFVQERPVEQVHFCVGYPGLRVVDERRYAMAVLNTVLGGGMSSRLFQKIREEYGLAYSVYSYHSTYQDTGMQTVYCGTSRDGFAKALQIIREEAWSFGSDLVHDGELDTAKLQLKGNLLLGLESTGNRMNQLARNEIYFGRQISAREIEDEIDAVTPEQIRELASDLFAENRMALTVIGPISEEEVLEVRG
jgi:predicted Zn-dependent peptidase